MRVILIMIFVAVLVAGFVYTMRERDRRMENKAASRPASTLQEMFEEQGAEAKEGGSSKELLKQAKKMEEEVLKNKLQTPPPSDMLINPKKKYAAILHTEAGDIVILLNAKGVPRTVNNFVYLARQNFYNNTIFHRVIKDFVIQGGDPKGDGTGGPGYRFADEKFKGQYARGAVAMANAGPNTNGSQFFIMTSARQLVPNYVIFGQVAHGMEVVDKIAAAPTRPEGEGSTPLEPVVVMSVEIWEE